MHLSGQQLPRHGDRGQKLVLLGPLQRLGGVTINSVVVAALLAVPMYVCTCSDVPMVSALITKGMGGGAALAFLLGGPGLSIPSLTMLSGVFKKRLLLVYAAVSLVGCVVAGIVFNLIL